MSNKEAKDFMKEHDLYATKEDLNKTTGLFGAIVIGWVSYKVIRHEKLKTFNEVIKKSIQASNNN